MQESGKGKKGLSGHSKVTNDMSPGAVAGLQEVTGTQ